MTRWSGGADAAPPGPPLAALRSLGRSPRRASGHPEPLRRSSRPAPMLRRRPTGAPADAIRGAVQRGRADHRAHPPSLVSRSDPAHRCSRSPPLRGVATTSRPRTAASARVREPGDQSRPASRPGNGWALAVHGSVDATCSWIVLAATLARSDAALPDAPVVARAADREQWPLLRSSRRHLLVNHCSPPRSPGPTPPSRTRRWSAGTGRTVTLRRCVRDAVDWLPAPHPDEARPGWWKTCPGSPGRSGEPGLEGLAGRPTSTPTAPSPGSAPSRASRSGARARRARRRERPPRAQHRLSGPRGRCRTGCSPTSGSTAATAGSSRSASTGTPRPGTPDRGPPRTWGTCSTAGSWTRPDAAVARRRDLLVAELGQPDLLCQPVSGRSRPTPGASGPDWLSHRQQLAVGHHVVASGLRRHRRPDGRRPLPADHGGLPGDRSLPEFFSGDDEAGTARPAIVVDVTDEQGRPAGSASHGGQAWTAATVPGRRSGGPLPATPATTPGDVADRAGS
ncbi:hypothetical protein HBB16_00720 [Pseudonocardia sp. MCCB 268]|nr:hypothetical protein [Pseudonocardia cytotoxica]